MHDDVDRILAKVGPPLPTHFDRQQLIQDIGWIDTLIHVAASLKPSNQKKRRRDLRLAVKAAKSFQLYAKNAGLRITPSFSHEIKKAETELGHRLIGKPENSLSPMEWVVNNYLREIFTKHFGERVTNYPDSRFVRFAHAALASVGRRYTAASIVRALSNAGGRRHVGKTKSKTRNRPSIRS